MMKTIADIMNMLDLFYANKHLYDKVKAYRQKHNIPDDYYMRV